MIRTHNKIIKKLLMDLSFLKIKFINGDYRQITLMPFIENISFFKF